MIESRLESVGLKSQLLPRDAVEAAVRFIATIDGEVGLPCQQKRDISDDSRDEVIHWIRGLGLPMNELATAIWVSNREGAVLALSDFIEKFDDLWYPAADDVWLIGTNEKWLLEFSHEEIVTLWKT